MFPPDTKVLIVDNMMAMRKLLVKICTDLKFTQILEAEDGAKAWEIIQSTAPPVGLVLSDWNMPNCSGFDLLKRIRSDSRFTKLPFVFVTAESGSQHISDALKAGVNSYIVKPFTQDVLVEKLEVVYKRHISSPPF